MRHGLLVVDPLRTGCHDMTGGELVGFIAIVVGGMSWAVGWWLENVRQTTRRYRHSVVKMRIADHRNADGIDLRQIPKGKSHVILWFKPKVHLEVVGYDVRFVAGAGEEEDVPRVSPDVLRVTRAMIADDTEQSIWPAPIDDGHGGMRGDEPLSLPAGTGMLLRIEIEANGEVWSRYLALSLCLNIKGAREPYYARVPARTVPMPMKSGDEGFSLSTTPESYGAGNSPSA